jgi:CDP-diacylglycerol--glycerol-3-phosphate 3-phosphatidyltransferase
MTQSSDVHETSTSVPVHQERSLNLPNIITLVRIGAVPILFLHPYFMDQRSSWLMAWLFIVAVLTDVLDGWIARSWKMVTRLGKLLDPLADKLLVSTALVMLLASGRLEAWAAPMVVIIIGRELAVTGLRGIASAEGVIVAASRWGKLKTLSQNAAVIALLFHYTTFGLPAHDIGLVLLTVASGLTMWSGWIYFSNYFGWSGSTS